VKLSEPTGTIGGGKLTTRRRKNGVNKRNNTGKKIWEKERNSILVHECHAPTRPEVATLETKTTSTHPAAQWRRRGGARDRGGKRREESLPLWLVNTVFLVLCKPWTKSIMIDVPLNEVPPPVVYFDMWTSIAYIPVW